MYMYHLYSRNYFYSRNCRSCATKNVQTHLQIQSTPHETNYVLDLNFSAT